KKIKIDGKEGNCSRGAWIDSICIDSRACTPGALFFALPGTKTDGSLFAEEALKKGAAAVVSERKIKMPQGSCVIYVRSAKKALTAALLAFFGDPSGKLKIIGITGTNGKTTTAFLLKSVFESAGHKTALLGTVNYYIGRKKSPAILTTPSQVFLYEFFNKAVKAGAEYLVMEVSSHSLKTGRVDGVPFEGAVFTNITRDHLDFHHTYEDYYQSKKILFTQMAEGKGKIKSTVINSDDAFGRRLAGEAGKKLHVDGISLKNPDIRVEEMTLNGVKISIGGEKISSRLVGRHNIYNITEAFVTARNFGIAPRDIARGIGKVKNVPGRFEIIYNGEFCVAVDYAHTPDALLKTLKTAAGLKRKRLIAVFGCGGDRDKKKRAPMGRIAADIADSVYVTSDNPRTENPSDIIGQIVSGLKKSRGYARKKSRIIEDRRLAIRSALKNARKGDLIVIAGKGHEKYQIIGSKKLPFSDRACALGFIKEFWK
ncbi:MAG: UDP-N-acetylmuramoyl-L-alanyl-D-glutamate--2,6-diaminopimelate ligase, partial [Lentisphaerae bacterium GWF2_52_8]